MISTVVILAMALCDKVDLVKVKFVALIKRFTWLDWAILGLLIVLGLYLVGIVVFRSLRKTPSVEYLTKTEDIGSNANRDIWVDVSGAVVSPGVYKLADEARTKDALIAAGGLTDEADRVFVARVINLAQKVNDGDKIFIPTMGGEVAGVTTGKVNLNKAATDELMSLDGIGAARAQTIIKNRPYAKVEELLTKKIVTKSVFEKIKDQIVVY